MSIIEEVIHIQFNNHTPSKELSKLDNSFVDLNLQEQPRRTNTNIEALKTNGWSI